MWKALPFVYLSFSFQDRMGEAVLFSSAANTACPISPRLGEMHNEIFNVTLLLNTILSLQ